MKTAFRFRDPRRVSDFVGVQASTGECKQRSIVWHSVLAGLDTTRPSAWLAEARQGTAPVVREHLPRS